MLKSGKLHQVVLAFSSLLLLAAHQGRAGNHDRAVVERNLAPAGASMQIFASGSDAVNRFNGALSYALPLGIDYPLGGGFSYQTVLQYSSSIWHLKEENGAVHALPDENTNAGLGWRISWGDLHPPQSAENPTNFWIYESSSGHRSNFYSTLNDGETSENHVFYSRDSTYLRLRFNGSLAYLDHPDGGVRTFTFGPDGKWRVTELRDVDDNFLKIEYKSTYRQLVDSQGRIHRIYWVADPSGYYPQLVDRVELASFGGGVAVYTFHYDTSQVQKPDPENAGQPLSTTTALPTLTAVDFPDGSSYSFEYSTTAGYEAGRLTSVELPNGGHIDYAYGTVEFPYLSGAEAAADSVGISSRSLATSQGVLGTWTLGRAFDKPRVAGTIEQPRELTVTVTHPDGHYTEHFFSVYVTGDAASNQSPPSYFSSKKYGLPITANDKPATNPYHFSKKTYDSDGTLLRASRLNVATNPCSGCWDVQERVDKRRTDYEDDGGWRVVTKLSNFNGLGTFGQIEELDSFATAGKRTTVYNVSSTPPSSGSRWLLNQVTQTTISQGGESFTTEQCFGPNGKTSRSRIWAGTSRGAHDLLKTYHYDSNGNLSETRYFGGDLQSLSTASGDLCALSLPANEEFASYQAFSFGTLSERGWLKSDGSVHAQTYEATIDPSTGLVGSSHDGDEFVWVHTYDALGRRTTAVPPTGFGGRQSWIYTPADPSDPTGSPETLHQITFAADDTVLKEGIVVLDELKRVVKTSKNTSAGWAHVLVESDYAGRTTAITSPTGAVQQWLAFDPFGRPLHYRPADGAQHDRFYSYSGIRTSSETFSIGKQWDEATSSVVEIARTVTRTVDRNGQLVQKITADADGDSQTETLTVNARGFVTHRVLTDGTTTEEWTAVDRRDGRGFVTQDHQGQTISDYNALGLRTLVDFGQGPLAKIYDRAGRLIEEREGNSNGLLWSQFTYADANVGGDYRRGKMISALRVNRSVPHVPDGYVEVEELYAYNGQDGRKSAATTQITAGISGSMPLFSFTGTLVRDGLGRIESLTYPDCAVDAANPYINCERMIDREVHYGYNLEDLVSISSTVGLNGSQSPENWIDQITYDVAGTVLSRSFGNGFVETRTPHISGEGRLERLVLQDPQQGTLYDSGIAQYDGHGRLVKLGNQRRISDSTYSLDLTPTSDFSPTPSGNPGPAKDIYGLVMQSYYEVPSRLDPVNGAAEKNWNINIYGPNNRLVWQRVFNDYDAYNYDYSHDRWFLVDPTGRKVREREGLTYYIDSQSTYANAQMEWVFLIGHMDRKDTVYEGSRFVGTSDGHLTAPEREFLHRDFQGRLFATSDQDGDIVANASWLY